MSHAQQLKKAPAHWDPLTVAAHSAVEAFKADGKSGAKAMGPRIGKSPHYLNNELNGNNAAKLGLTTAYFIDCELPQPTILYKYAEMLNHACFPLPDPEHFTGDVELLSRFSDWQSAMGFTCSRIHGAFDPKSENGSKISKGEAKEIREAAVSHIAKLMEFLNHIDEVAE